MLRVPALELRDPVLLLVLVVSHDLTVHGLTLLYKSRPNGWPAASMKADSEFLLTNLTPSVIK
ncbi:MAG: hypothetical protein ABI785_04625 [Gemmatimonadales bacterium]